MMSSLICVEQSVCIEVVGDKAIEVYMLGVFQIHRHKHKHQFFDTFLRWQRYPFYFSWGNSVILKLNYLLKFPLVIISSLFTELLSDSLLVSLLVTNFLSFSSFKNALICSSFLKYIFPIYRCKINSCFFFFSTSKMLYYFIFGFRFKKNCYPGSRCCSPEVWAAQPG